MPKHRPIPPSAKLNCSFCGRDKDDVPLLVRSNVTQACVCSVCALAVIEQTYSTMMGMKKLIDQATRPQQPPQKPEGDATENAIERSGTG